MVFPRRVCLFEFKLSFLPEALGQMREYASILSRIFGRPVIEVLVCKNLRKEASQMKLLPSLEEAPAALSSPWLWHEPLLYRNI